jgi:predicted metal-dependent hydrolase
VPTELPQPDQAAPLCKADPRPAVDAPHAVELRRSLRAIRYRLSVKRDGTAVLTIPAHGSEQHAQQFLESQGEWLERARSRMARLPRGPSIWKLGTEILWRGRLLPIEPAEAGSRPAVAIGSDRFPVRSFEGDLRPALETRFRQVARIELPPRTWELAAIVGVRVGNVVVRDQRTRWGSCSSTGTISLNWRLVRTPSQVTDYIILHELMHRREMNHSARFWELVEEVCPGWRDAELWIKAQGAALEM